ncbi:MAG: ATP-dependent DNA ligase [Nitrososphaeraceae archaeon]|nr:ATP-dependent DNA ligase [Nitrososphaeraceae archaeon]MBV9667065.1 ATP-dependent DNA ligase [Nitrososphaeraceae archaeon]
MSIHSSNNNFDQFSHFVDTCEKIHAVASKNTKVRILSEYLACLDKESLPIAVLFFSNRVFPPGSKFVMNIGFNTIIRVLSEIATLDPNQIQRIYLKHGDMGALSEYAVSKKNMVSLFQQQALTLLSIYDRLKEIADTIGSGSNKDKKNILKGLLINSSPLEAKYLIKIINGEMRIGLTEGLVEIAVSKAFDQELEHVRDAMLFSGDISKVSLLAKRNLLHTALIKLLSPISYMLADVMLTAEEIIKYYNKPLICEYKYDGIRAQVHKFGQEVRLFSRKLVDVTNAFPELVNAALAVRSSSSDIDFILDGEVMAFQNGKPLHFHELQKRLHKKNVTEQIMTDVPLVYVVYDIMYFNGENTIGKSIKGRKEILSNISFKDPIINSTYRVVNSEQEIIAMFEESRDIGHEGLVLKDLDSQYHPGKRGRYWMKLKKELDTIDAVVVIAEYGHGKRAGVLSDYTFAVRDDTDSNQLRTIGKAYSGLTDDEIFEITKKLRSIMIKDEGYSIIVKPEIVLEIAFDSIQKSNRHDSGFALRFPRIKNIREDKDAADIDTLQKVKQIYEKQTYIMSKIGRHGSRD